MSDAAYERPSRRESTFLARADRPSKGTIDVRKRPLVTNPRGMFGSSDRRPLLQVFSSVAHDPIQVSRQGAELGTQYRSAIFYADEPLEAFYPAEEYHHNYAENNPNQPYICAVPDPKVKNSKKSFPIFSPTGADNGATRERFSAEIRSDAAEQRVSRTTGRATDTRGARSAARAGD